MDIELFSKMVGELLRRDGEVVLPGFGTLGLEMHPASFSDRGFTLNPPYKRLVFNQDANAGIALNGGGVLAIYALYASANRVGLPVAAAVVQETVSVVASGISTARDFPLPGLGRFRMMHDGTLFFVQNPDAALCPELDFLTPVSLKSLERVPGHTPSVERSALPEPVQEEPVPAQTPEPVQEEPAPAQTPEPVQEEPAPAQTPEPVQEEPVPAQAPEPVQKEPVSAQTPELVQEEPAPAQTPEPVTEAGGAVDEERESVTDDWNVQDVAEREIPVAPGRPSGAARFFKTLLLIFIIVLILAAGGLALLAILGRYCPEMVDPLLYSPAQIDILNLRF